MALLAKVLLELWIDHRSFRAIDWDEWQKRRCGLGIAQQLDLVSPRSNLFHGLLLRVLPTC